jgi:hypothetical protein
MIITLENAQKIDPNITQEMLDAYEAAIRQYTHNNFQVQIVRSIGLTFSDDIITTSDDILTSATFENDTIQVSNTDVNDGLYVVKTKNDDHTIIVDRTIRKDGEFTRAFATLVVYPNDIKQAVRRIVEFNKARSAELDATMSANAARGGVKSQSVSRMSNTFLTLNDIAGGSSGQGSGSGSFLDGYPDDVKGLINGHKKLNWGI